MKNKIFLTLAIFLLAFSSFAQFKTYRIRANYSKTIYNLTNNTITTKYVIQNETNLYERFTTLICTNINGIRSYSQVAKEHFWSVETYPEGFVTKVRLYYLTNSQGESVEITTNVNRSTTSPPMDEGGGSWPITNSSGQIFGWKMIQAENTWRVINTNNNQYIFRLVYKFPPINPITDNRWILRASYKVPTNSNFTITVDTACLRDEFGVGLILHGRDVGYCEGYGILKENWQSNWENLLCSPSTLVIIPPPIPTTNNVQNPPNSAPLISSMKIFDFETQNLYRSMSYFPTPPCPGGNCGGTNGPITNGPPFILTNQYVQMTFLANIGQTYTAQSSTNLVDWEMISYVKDLLDGSYLFKDEYPLQVNKVYRILNAE